MVPGGNIVKHFKCGRSLNDLFIMKHCWVCWGKNLDNQSTFGKVVSKSTVLFFSLMGSIKAVSQLSGALQW